MKTRNLIVCLSGLAAVALSGCSENTDVSKKLNDDWKNHVAGPRPPAGAMNGPKGGPVGPFKDTGGVPANSGAPAGSGPGKPTGDDTGSAGDKGGANK